MFPPDPLGAGPIGLPQMEIHVSIGLPRMEIHVYFWREMSTNDLERTTTRNRGRAKNI